MQEIPVRAKKAWVDPSSFFIGPVLERFVTAQVCEEAAMREAANMPPLNSPEVARLRAFVIYRLCAEMTPAGNA